MLAPRSFQHHSTSRLTRLVSIVVGAAFSMRSEVWLRRPPSRTSIDRTDQLDPPVARPVFPLALNTLSTAGSGIEFSCSHEADRGDAVVSEDSTLSEAEIAQARGHQLHQAAEHDFEHRQIARRTPSRSR